LKGPWKKRASASGDHAGKVESAATDHFQSVVEDDLSVISMGMAGNQKTLDQILEGRRTIPFRDFETLLGALGFTLARQRGSHRVYFHAKTRLSFPVQPDGHDAKHYQVRQLRDMIRKYGLRLDNDR
jgi:predicted RNA binding protein YcfA (HicA-like mRNA interferase family)